MPILVVVATICMRTPKIEVRKGGLYYVTQFLVPIRVVIAIIHMRTSRTEVEKDSKETDVRGAQVVADSAAAHFPGGGGQAH